MPKPQPSPLDPLPPAPRDPGTNLEFWGRDRASLGRSGIARVADRLRGDSRVGVVALLVVALLVGLVWYRLGSAQAAKGAEPAHLLQGVAALPLISQRYVGNERPNPAVQSLQLLHPIVCHGMYPPPLGPMPKFDLDLGSISSYCYPKGKT